MNFSQGNRIPAVLVDLDGTLVDVRSIRHYVENGNHDFDAFHLESINCPPNQKVLELLEALSSQGLAVLVVTARTEKYRRLTDFWLAQNNVECKELVMRDLRDGRPDIEVKTSMFNRLNSKYEIRVAIDDRQDLLENWSNLGISQVIWVRGDDATLF